MRRAIKGALAAMLSCAAMLPVSSTVNAGPTPGASTCYNELTAWEMNDQFGNYFYATQTISCGSNIKIANNILRLRQDLKTKASNTKVCTKPSSATGTWRCTQTLAIKDPAGTQSMWANAYGTWIAFGSGAGQTPEANRFIST